MGPRLPRQPLTAIAAHDNRRGLQPPEFHTNSHRIAIQMMRGPGRWNLALNNAKNLQDDVARHVEIERGLRPRYW